MRYSKWLSIRRRIELSWHTFEWIKFENITNVGDGGGGDGGDNPYENSTRRLHTMHATSDKSKTYGQGEATRAIRPAARDNNRIGRADPSSGVANWLAWWGDNKLFSGGDPIVPQTFR